MSVKMSVKLSTGLRATRPQHVARLISSESFFHNDLKMAEIQLLTPDAVCKALAISPTTLWRLSKSGQLVPLYVLSSPRYTHAQLKSFVSRQQKKALEGQLND
jgi:hypothetical protein